MASGLFPSQAQVFAAQQAQQAANPLQTLAGGIFNLGDALGDAGRRGIFGQETRSPAELAAGKVQQIAQRIDFNDRESIMGGINALNDAGFQDQAFQLFNTLPQPTEAKVTPITKPYQKSIQDPSNPGNFVLQWAQDYSDGSTKFLGTALANETAPASTGGKALLPDYLAKPFAIQPKVEDRWLTELSQAPELNRWFKDDAERETLYKSGVSDWLANKAQDLKDQRLNRLYEIQQQIPEMDKADLIRLARDLRITDRQIANDAWNLMKESGNYRQLIDTGVFTTEARSGFGQSINPISQDQQDAADAQAETQVEQQVLSTIAPVVQGDPRAGQFRQQSLNLPEAKVLFSNIGNMGDDELVERLGGLGYNFNQPGLLEYHRSEWSNLREVPAIASMYFINTGTESSILNPTLDRSNFGAEYAQWVLDQGNNLQAIMQGKQAVKYLEQFTRKGGSNSGNTRTGFGGRRIPQ